MRKLYIRFQNSRANSIFRKYGWVAILPLFVMGMAMLPLNILNGNRVKGVVVFCQHKEHLIKVARRGSGYADYLMLYLPDSTAYGAVKSSHKEQLENMNIVGKEVKITYTDMQGANLMCRLEVDGEVIIDQNKWAVSILIFLFFWVVFWGINEIVMIWKSV